MRDFFFLYTEKKHSPNARNNFCKFYLPGKMVPPTGKTNKIGDMPKYILCR